MLVLNYVNHTQLPVDDALINRVRTALDKLCFKGQKAAFELSFVSWQAIKGINKKYRGKDQVTDVLSFIADMPVMKGHPKPLGEVLVCLSRAKSQAKKYGHSEQREVAFLIVHGVLHLLGYDHQAPAEERKMQAMAEKVMSALKLTR